jgi:Na+/H+-dicarboxylate symporter
MIDPVTALAVFVGWTLLAVALGCLVGKVIKFGIGDEPYDWERDQ